VHERLATLFTLIEASGCWPRELAQGYVALIPKASGGSRPQDQRPIAVLDLVYRIWAKGTTLSWSPFLQRQFLGSTVLGFRAQAGTGHVAQLLSDVIVLQQRRNQGLFLVSFDVEKCFATLPWWAVFGSLERAGAVRCFRAYYMDCVSGSGWVRWTAKSGAWKTAWPRVAKLALTC